MELQALLVLCGAGVAVVAVLLLAGLFSTAGTSYEEAVAQQRRATTELLALASNKNKPKKTKKANKKLAKKERKESASAVTVSDQDSEVPGESGVDEEPAAPVRPHVEFKPPVVVDIPCDSPPNVKIRKRGKDPKVKPILLNKDDPSCVSDPSTPPSPSGSSVSNHFEEIHPKDECELLHLAQAADKAVEKKEEVIEKKEKPSKPGKGAKAATKPAPVEVIKEEPPQKERHNSGDAPKEQRKAKKGEKKVQVEEVVDVAEEVVPPLNIPHPSELTTEKILKQAMAPSLTVGPKGKKNKKPEPNVLSLMAGDGGGVNVGELVRLMSEAPLSRTEIQILTDALLNKHHDQLPQHSEWTEGPNDPMQKLKKQLAEKEKALADELEASQALHAKLKELRGLLNAERSRASATARALEEAATTHQRLIDDNHTLAQEKMHLQSKLSAEGEAQAQRVQMEMHIQRLSESEAALVQQLSALQAEVTGRALEAGQARCEATAARDSMLLTQQHAAEIAQQLQEANRVCSELDSQRSNAIHAEQLAQQELRQLQERLNVISELQAEVQRLTTCVQQAESLLEKTKEEAEKQKQQLSCEVSSLRSQMEALEAELRPLRTPAQNGLPDTEHKASELAKVESVMEALRAELSAAQSDARDQKEQVDKLHQQLQHYQDKNNELRTKNWKVMEALQSAERSLQSKTTSALPARDQSTEATMKAQEAQYSEVAAVLKGVSPHSAPTSAPSKDWLETFASNLKLELAKGEELRAQNEQLQGAVDKYKTIIDDTEGVLSRLQQNVSEEEERWEHKMADLQRQIDELSQHDTQSQKKIVLLEAELRQAKNSSGPHSFTDSERLTEENSRLMSELADKHRTYNGPLQMGLEEI